MVNIAVVTKRELNTYFFSPMAYVVLTGFALIHGLLFAIFATNGVIDPDITAGGAFWIAFYMMLLAAPVITMRLLSEESNSGTLETLLTTPISETEVVLGKYMGALIFAMIVQSVLLFEFAFLATVAELDYGRLAAGFLGMFLLTAQFLAVGLLCSSFSRMQIASAIVSFAILLGLFFLWYVIKDSASTAAAALRYLAPPIHFMGFLKGVIDSRDLVYFGASTLCFLYITVRVLELRKWR